MKITFALPLFAALVVAGCATVPPTQNPSGQPIKFVAPVLGKAAMDGAKYVLLEKNISDGRYKLVSMSKSRQPIVNARQERIAFNADLTAYAPDYVDTPFETYVDRGNYGMQTVITKCGDFPLKTKHYSPCNSEFGDVFIPMGITKLYVAGSMGYQQKKEWEDPALNRMRSVNSPQYALRQAGVFERLSELAAAN